MNSPLQISLWYTNRSEPIQSQSRSEFSTALKSLSKVEEKWVHTVVFMIKHFFFFPRKISLVFDKMPDQKKPPQISYSKPLLLWGCVCIRLFSISLKEKYFRKDDKRAAAMLFSVLFGMSNVLPDHSLIKVFCYSDVLLKKRIKWSLLKPLGLSMWCKLLRKIWP